MRTPTLLGHMAPGEPAPGRVLEIATCRKCGKQAVLRNVRPWPDFKDYRTGETECCGNTQAPEGTVAPTEAA